MSEQEPKKAISLVVAIAVFVLTVGTAIAAFTAKMPFLEHLAGRISIGIFVLIGALVAFLPKIRDGAGRALILGLLVLTLFGLAWIMAEKVIEAEGKEGTVYVQCPLDLNQDECRRDYKESDGELAAWDGSWLWAMRVGYFGSAVFVILLTISVVQSLRDPEFRRYVDLG